MKRLLDWIERNTGPLEAWLGIAFFAMLFVLAASLIAARAVGY